MPALAVDLDRSSPVPLYCQVAQQIEHAINEGGLAAGDRLDNEISLAKQFGLSRPTMRRAIQELVDKGLLVRRRGVGTQVVHGRISRPVALTSLYDDLTTGHQRPRTDVLANEVLQCTDEVAAVLAVRPGSNVLYLRRLRFTHDEPLAVMENYLPEDLIPLGERDLTRHGLYQLMRSRGVHIRVAKQRIGARSGTDEECTLLGERHGSPVITIDRATHDDSGRAVEWGRHAYRSSQYSYEVTLVAH